MSFLKTTFIVVSLLLSIASKSQSLNNYQYIIIPEQFEFQKKQHQYDVNKLTQFLFNKYNFKAFIKGEQLPEGANICDALEASVAARGIMKTVMVLSLLNCNGEKIYISSEGVSRKKDYKKAYHEAMRNIFNDPRLKTHKYIPVKNKEAKHSQKTEPLAATVKLKAPKPTSEKPLLLQSKRSIENPAKATGPNLIFELRSKQYVFKPIGEKYIISEGKQIIGEANLNPNNTHYTINAGSLSGTGTFDDYGNFELKRKNPVTQKIIIDILARVN